MIYLLWIIGISSALLLVLVLLVSVMDYKQKQKIINTIRGRERTISIPTERDGDE